MNEISSRTDEEKKTMEQQMLSTQNVRSYIRRRLFARKNNWRPNFSFSLKNLFIIITNNNVSEH